MMQDSSSVELVFTWSTYVVGDVDSVQRWLPGSAPLHQTRFAYLLYHNSVTLASN